MDDERNLSPEESCWTVDSTYFKFQKVLDIEIKNSLYLDLRFGFGLGLDTKQVY